MIKGPSRIAIATIAIALAATASMAGRAKMPKGGAAAFTVRTTPAGATVDTTRGFRCTTPCQVPLGAGAFVVTIAWQGYKPVQIPVAAGQNPGDVDVKLVAQDPGANAPNPVK